MKRILLLMILSCFTAVGFAQTLVDGDYRTAKTSGNWSDADMWERRSGGTWAITATSPTASNNVYVQAGHAVTVDAANVSVKDLQLNTTGKLDIGVNIVNVNGKIRAFTDAAVTGSADGVYTTNAAAPTSTCMTTTGSGYLNFVGGTRTIAAAGEWANSGTTNAAQFTLDAGSVGTFVTGFKFKDIVINSGTVASNDFTSPQTTNLTIKSGAKLTSTRSGLFLSNNSTTKTGVLTIEAGAVLELSGSAPTIAVTAFINNGTVVYNRAGTQTLLASALDGTTNIHNYNILELNGSNTKTLAAATTVNSIFRVAGTAAVAASVANTLTFLNNSTIERSSTISTPIPSSNVLYGSTATDLVHVTILGNVNNSNELASAPAPGKIGTLTVGNGFTYTITGGRTISNLVTNGVLALVPATTFTLVINGDIGGAGTITGNANASLTFGGSNNGNAGVVNFTAGSENLFNLAINRTGTDPSVSIGSSLVLANNLTLTNGIVNILPGKSISMQGSKSITSSSTNYINTQTSGASVGKLIITGLSSSKLIPIGTVNNYLPVTLNPTVASDFDINVFAGATADATPNGTALTAAQKLRMVDAVWNINRTSGTGNADVTLAWPAALEGADFSGFGNAQIGIAGYAGTYGAFTGSGNAAANTATLNTATFSQFVVGEANTTLPLTLISFTAKESLNSVKLAWQTTDEVNLKNYVLQHKTANGFKDIYTVAANNKVGVFNYDYTHLNPVAGANYYRLVGVDLDGAQHISEPKFVNVTLANAVAVYPNPVTRSAISVSGLVNGDIIKILNIQGQVIATQKAIGNQVQEINVQNIQAGTYILSVENAGKVTATKKLIKI